MLYFCILISSDMISDMTSVVNCLTVIVLFQCYTMHKELNWGLISCFVCSEIGYIYTPGVKYKEMFACYLYVTDLTMHIYTKLLMQFDEQWQLLCTALTRKYAAA